MNNNTTRFLIMAKDTSLVEKKLNNKECMTTLVFEVRNLPAALYKALGGFATNGVNMLKLESYMVAGSFTSTQFYADIEGSPDQETVARAIEELNGQFAFALYDSKNGKLTLARDRFGEQPLYLYENQNKFAFASEIKAFACLPETLIELDPVKLAKTAMFWTSLPHETVFKYINQLPPSHYAVIERGVKKTVRYSDVPFRPSCLPKTEGEAAEAVRFSMKQAVKLRLRSDVEIGVYLSGGLDSTITSSLARKATSEQLKSFSIAFDDFDYDETSFQKKASSALNLRTESLRISHGDIRRALPHVIGHAETILFRNALVPLYLLAEHVNKSGIKVILTGEGADEMFLGYDIFKEAWLIEHFDS